MRQKIIARPMVGVRSVGEGRLPVWLCALLILGVSGGVYVLLFRLIAAIW